MQHTPAKELLQKYTAGLCTEEEEALIESWYLQLHADEANLSVDQVEASLNLIEEGLPLGQPKRRSKFTWYKAAGLTIIIVTISVVGYLRAKRLVGQTQLVENAKSIKTGDKAILTLASGRKIILNNTGNSQLAKQGNVTISNTASGHLEYKTGTTATKEDNQLNTITIPKGGHYQLTLADGTKIWLNAASTITYPVAFPGNNREVSVTGEAYFEVAKNKVKPFFVKSGTQTVRVLGTHFNINTFLDNGPFIETTLLEGSVEVFEGSSSAIIKPGEQARVSANVNKSGISVILADTEEIMAWRNGDLVFEDQNIRGIMNKVSRIYDVDVEFRDNLPDEKFNAEVSHAANISEVLIILQKTFGVHFTIEGRRIIVAP